MCRHVARLFLDFIVIGVLRVVCLLFRALPQHLALGVGLKPGLAAPAA